jgi:hypothetical protein
MSDDVATDIQWLREIEASDSTRSPTWRIQGPLLDSILISQGAYDDSDSYALIQANIDFVNWARGTAFFVVGEFPQQAIWSYYVDYYRAQVCNGGHGQFWGNSAFTPLIAGSCLRGLRAMGAMEHLAMFEELAALVAASGDEQLTREAKQAVLKSLDERFFAIESSDILVARNDAWLRGLDCLRRLDEELEQELDAAQARNQLHTSRSQEWAQTRRAYEQDSATYRVIKSLCKGAGRIFFRLSAGANLPMRMVSSAAPDREEFCWGVATDKGVHHVFFYQQPGFFHTKLHAEMWSQDAPGPAASAVISKADYEEIVPAWMRAR